VVLFGDKLAFTQTDGNEYIDSLNDGYLDIGATTAVRINNILKLTPTSAPESPEEGMVYCNSTNHHIYFYNGTGWIQLD